MKKGLEGKIKCAITHDLDTCNECDLCIGKNFAERRCNLLNDVENLFTILNVVERIIKDNDSYINADFAQGTKLYIDGTATYESENEKQIIQEWIKEVKENEN